MEEPALRLSHISPAEARLDGAGNRFDIAGAGVLYGASDRQGCIAETIAHYRPKASLIAKMAAAANDGEEPPVAGMLEVSWRSTRMIRSVRTIDSLPFVDIEAAKTHTYLTRNAANLLHGLGIDNLGIDNLNVAAVSGRPGPSPDGSQAGCTAQPTKATTSASAASGMCPGSAITNAGPSSTEPKP